MPLFVPRFLWYTNMAEIVPAVVHFDTQLLKTTTSDLKVPLSRLETDERLQTLFVGCSLIP